MKFANATELLTDLATQRFSLSVDHLGGAGNRQPAVKRGTRNLRRYYKWSGLSDIGPTQTYERSGLSEATVNHFNTAVPTTPASWSTT
jgi:hypothetical protein